jgi:hypothetical protein
MKTLASYKLTIRRQFNESELLKGLFIVILHANRIPPHIGLIAGKKYHSLTIKGRETDQSPELILKNIRIRKIPSLFIQIKDHPTFSHDYLKEHFIQDVSQFSKVAIDGATCLSPVKDFFAEVYSVDVSKTNFIFELIPQLESLGLVMETSSLFIEENEFSLPVYKMDDINKGIDAANEEAKLVKLSSLNKS